MPPRRIRIINDPAPRARRQPVRARRAGLPFQALRPARRGDIAYEQPLDAPERQTAPQGPGDLAPGAAQGGGTATQGTQQNAPRARRQPVKRRRAGLPIQALRPARRGIGAHEQPLDAPETQAAPQSPDNLAPQPTRGRATVSPGIQFTAINVPRARAAPTPHGPTRGGGMLNRGPGAIPFPDVVPPGPVQGTVISSDGQVLPRVEAQRRAPPSPDTIRFGLRRNPPAGGSSEEDDY
jgi:hypothetical protein